MLAHIARRYSGIVRCEAIGTEQLETRKNLSHLSAGYDSLFSWGIWHESKQSIRSV